MRPPHARSLKTRSAAVPGTAHDLLFSFTKKAKLGGGCWRERKKRKKIAPRKGCCDRDRPQQSTVGGKGSDGDWIPGGHAPLLLFWSLRFLPFPLGATNGQQLTSPASKPCRTLRMVFPRRLGRNSSGSAPWECKSEGHKKIFLFLPDSAKPLTAHNCSIFFRAFRVLGDLSSCNILAAPTFGALSEFLYGYLYFLTCLPPRLSSEVPIPTCCHEEFTSIFITLQRMLWKY